MHVAKFDKGGAKRIFDHVMRTRDTHTESEIDKSRTHLNETVVPPLPPAVLAEYDKLAKRKDAVMLLDVVLTLPEELKHVSRRKQLEFFKEAAEGIGEHIGGVCAFAEVHYDETTPHLHYGIVPITTDNRLCAKDICNRKMLKGLHPAVEEHLQEHGIDIHLFEHDEEQRLALHAAGGSKRDMQEYRKHMKEEGAREQYEQETEQYIQNYQNALKRSKKPVKREKGESKEDFKQRKKDYVMVNREAYEGMLAFRYDVQTVEAQAKAAEALERAEKHDSAIQAEYDDMVNIVDKYQRAHDDLDREVDKRAFAKAQADYREWTNSTRDDIRAGVSKLLNRLEQCGQKDFVDKVLSDHQLLSDLLENSPELGKGMRRLINKGRGIDI